MVTPMAETLAEKLEAICSGKCPDNCASKYDRFEGARIALEMTLEHVNACAEYDPFVYESDIHALLASIGPTPGESDEE